MTVQVPTGPAGPKFPAPRMPEVDLGELLPSEAGSPALTPDPDVPPPAPEPRPFDLEQFLGGSVTVLGDVVIESVDLADDDTRPPGTPRDRPGGTSPG
jgi:hypothetical protein